MKAVVYLQHVEIGEVRETREVDDGDVDRPVEARDVFPLQRDGILFLDPYIAEPRDDAYHRDAGQLLQYLPSVSEKGCVAPEFIDDNTFYKRPFLRA